MHSQAICVWSIRKINILLLSLVAVVGCEGNSTSRELPGVISDTTSPGVVRVDPEGDTTGYEVDFKPSVIFTEVVDIDSILNGGVTFYSGQADLSEIDTLVVRDIDVTHNSIPSEEILIDELSGDLIEEEVSEVTLSLETGRLALNSAYTIVVDDTIHDLVEDDLSTSADERNYLSSVVVSSFFTEQGEWHQAEKLDFKYLSSDKTQALTHQGDSLDPVVLAMENGDIIAVWRQIVDGYAQIWASQYLVDQEVWALPGASSVDSACLRNPLNNEPSCVNSVRLDINDSSNAYSPSLAVNKSGNVVVVWSQADSVDSNDAVWITLFDGSSWTKARHLLQGEFATTEASVFPLATMTNSGQVFISWFERVGASDRIRATQFDFDAGYNNSEFGGFSYIDNPSSGEVGRASYLNLVATESGNGILIWSQIVDGNERVLSSMVVISNTGETTIGETVFIDEFSREGMHRAVDPKVAISANGDISVAWRESTGSSFDLLFNRNVGGIWGKPEKLENDDASDVGEVSLSYSGFNELFVSWVSQSDSGESTLAVRSFDRKEGWLPTEFLNLDGFVSSSTNERSPIVRFDLEGNASLITIQNSQNTTSVLARQYSVLAEEWSDKVELFSTNAVGADVVALNLQPIKLDGRMLSLWSGYDGENFSLTGSIFKEKIAVIE
jgi:hypothetical protein